MNYDARIVVGKKKGRYLIIYDNTVYLDVIPIDDGIADVEGEYVRSLLEMEGTDVWCKILEQAAERWAAYAVNPKFDVRYRFSETGLEPFGGPEGWIDPVRMHRLILHKMRRLGYIK